MINGKLIKTLRINHKKSRKQVANAIGRDESTIKKWEDGTRGMSLESIESIADYFKVSEALIVSRNKKLSIATKSITDLAVFYEKNTIKLKMIVADIFSKRIKNEDYSFLAEEFERGLLNLQHSKDLLKKKLDEDFKNYDKMNQILKK